VFLEAVIFRIEGRLALKKQDRRMRVTSSNIPLRTKPVTSHPHPHELTLVEKTAAQLSRSFGMDLLAHLAPTHTHLVGRQLRRPRYTISARVGHRG